MDTSVSLPVIPGYEIQEKLAAGGMGVVYRARDVTLGREVAIKMIRAELLESDDEDLEQSLSRFMTEARAVAQIRSNHVSQVLQFGKTQSGDLFLVLEFLDGVTLNQVLRKDGVIDIARCVSIGKQLCRGMQAAHRLGIVHRDLKPSNVMLVEQDGTPEFVKILDFGVAKRLGEADSGVTRQGMIVGTYTCMAPEQVIGETIDARTDIYALGVLLYRMCVGKAPFRGKNTAAVLYHHVNTEAPLPSVFSSQRVPKGFDQLVHMCLEKDPAKRPQTMSDLHALLENVDLQDFSPIAPAQLETIDVRNKVVASAEETFAISVSTELEEAIDKTEAVPTPFPNGIPASGAALAPLESQEQTPNTGSSAAFSPAFLSQPPTPAPPTTQEAVEQVAIPTAPQMVQSEPNKRLPLVIGAIAFLGICVVGLLVAAFVGGSDNENPLPPVVGAEPAPHTKSVADKKTDGAKVEKDKQDLEAALKSPENPVKKELATTEKDTPADVQSKPKVQTKAAESKAAPTKKVAIKKTASNARSVSKSTKRSTKKSVKKTTVKKASAKETSASKESKASSKKSAFIRVRTGDKK